MIPGNDIRNSEYQNTEYQNWEYQNWEYQNTEYQNTEYHNSIPISIANIISIPTRAGFVIMYIIFT